MLLEAMRSINNHFAADRSGNFFFPPEYGRFEVDNGILTGVKNKPLIGAYFAISGSVLNNGVYLVTDDLITLPDALNEEFDGVIYRLVVPREFVKLVERIKAFAESKDGRSSNIVSASFGIQSQSFATDSNGMKAGWQSVFGKELRKYKRMTPDIDL